jgi:hypothetical protein
MFVNKNIEHLLRVVTTCKIVVKYDKVLFIRFKLHMRVKNVTVLISNAPEKNQIVATLVNSHPKNARRQYSVKS